MNEDPSPTQSEALEVLSQQQQQQRPRETGVTLSGGFSFDLEKLFQQAVSAESGVAVLERLMVIRQQMNAEQAKREFDRALAEFQRDCPIIKKRKAVLNKDQKSVRYYFAPLDDVVQQVGPFLEKHGFSYTLTALVEPQWVRAVCKIKHRAGHSEESGFGVPIDPDAYMNLPQKYGGAMTFAKRYAFCNGFGILTADEDKDAAGEKPPAPSAPGDKAHKTPDEVKLLKQKLTDLTRSVHGLARGYVMDTVMRQNLNQWMIDEALITPEEKVETLTPERLALVVEKVQKKLQGPRTT